MLIVPLMSPLPVRADAITASGPVMFAEPAFRALWRRTDDLAQGRRSYLWGPIDKQSVVIAREPYAEAPGGSRLVEYFEKLGTLLTTRGHAPRSVAPSRYPSP